MSLGFGLLILHWAMFGAETTGFLIGSNMLIPVRFVTVNQEITGFLLILYMICMTVLRWRFPGLRWAMWFIVLDGVLCVLLYPLALALVLFSGMYYRMYGLAVLVLATMDIYIGGFAAVAGIGGLFLGGWSNEREQAFKWRDSEAMRYYEAEAMQNDLKAATGRIERMTVVSERARIAREIHDNAGHEIVAAYMSLQTARDVFEAVLGENAAAGDIMSLYDAALERLEKGAKRMREAVHNLAPVATLGVEALQETCKRFPAAKVQFNAFGDTSHVPVHVWGALEACLNEALTNAVRHAKPRLITINLDTTPHIIRLCVENDGFVPQKGKMGHGLRNLRHRVAMVGGSLAVDSGELFRVTCVVPIRVV